MGAYIPGERPYRPKPGNRGGPFVMEAEVYGIVEGGLQTAVEAGVPVVIPGATTGSLGAIQLAGDLGGTALEPTVPALADKSDVGHTHSWNQITDKPSAFAPSTHSHPWNQISDKPTTFPPATHSHSWSSLTGRPAEFPASPHTHPQSDITGLALTLENKSPLGHGHSMSDISELSTALSGKANSSHTHSIAQISGLAYELDEKAPTSHTHSLEQVIGLDSALSGKAAVSHSHTLGALSITYLDAVIDLNSIGQGLYHQPTNANAALARNYPAELAGLLESYTNGDMTYQRYTLYNGTGFYTRSRYQTTWYAWRFISDTRGGTGDLTAVSARQQFPIYRVWDGSKYPARESGLVRKNLVLNPCFRASSSGWYTRVGSSTTASLTRTATGGPSNRPYMTIQLASGSSWWRAATDISAVEPGKRYAWVATLKGNISAGLRVVWRLDSGTSEVSTSFTLDTTWREYFTSFVAPANAVSATIEVTGSGTSTSGYVSFTQTLFEQWDSSTVAPVFFDGSVDAVAGVDTYWTGAISSSISVSTEKTTNIFFGPSDPGLLMRPQDFWANSNATTLASVAASAQDSSSALYNAIVSAAGTVEVPLNLSVLGGGASFGAVGASPNRLLGHILPDSGLPEVAASARIPAGWTAARVCFAWVTSASTTTEARCRFFVDVARSRQSSSRPLVGNRYTSAVDIGLTQTTSVFAENHTTAVVPGDELSVVITRDAGNPADTYTGSTVVLAAWLEKM